jgi:Zn-dependent protease
MKSVGRVSKFFGILTVVLVCSACVAVIWGYIDMLYQIAFAGASAPAWIAVFNLLPIPPLDGWKVLGAVLPARTYWKIMSYERYVSFAVILLIFTGALDLPLGFIRGFFYTIVNFLPKIIFGF